MLLGARQFFERSGAPTPPLPYDYAVEYIETDGVASYIDTGVTPLLDSSQIHLSFNYVSWNTSYTIIGANSVCGAAHGIRNSDRVYGIGTNISSSSFNTSNPNIKSIAQLDVNIHDVIIYRSGVTWDGIIVSGNSESVTPTSFCLGSRGNSSVAPTSSPQRWFSNARFYSCRIYTNNVLVFDGIPVVANGVAGMYDSICGTVKTNAAATGTITAGPRV